MSLTDRQKEQKCRWETIMLTKTRSAYYVYIASRFILLFQSLMSQLSACILQWTDTLVA